MSRKKPRDWTAPGRRWNEGDARAALEALARSGLSADAFGRRHGFSGQRLRSWRGRVSESAVSSVASARLLVPVVVKGSVGPGTSEHDARAALVVRVGGAVIAIDEVKRVDPRWLAHVLLAMGGGA